MCGLVGGTIFNGDTIQQALRIIHHRGQDASKAIYYGNAGLWLGHNRLSIQALGTGADQPFETNNCALVFNGELWHRSLNEYKYLRGPSSTSTSDTELLALMYEEYGGDLEDFAKRLDGMFAFAICDDKRDRIVIARDWLGRIPLYIVVNDKGIAFASEAKALTVPLNMSFRGNSAVAQKISQVRLFPPGTIISYSLTDNKVIEHYTFNTFDKYKGLVEDWDSDDKGLEYYANGIASRLKDAVSNELVADVPLCTILSGGVDSTIITAILAKLVPNLRAYTVSVGASNGKDDLAFARRAAEAIGIPLTEVIISHDDVLTGLEDTVWAIEDDRWVQIAPSVPQIEMARRIGADGYKVVFGGEGSDELFASYNDVKRWSWQPQQYHNERIAQCKHLHNNNVIRGNKAMMWGGTVELRAPFLDLELVDFCMRIPTRYRSNDNGKGNVMKPVLREAFRGWVPDDLLMRKKVTFQEGAHSDWLKDYKEMIRNVFRELFM